MRQREKGAHLKGGRYKGEGPPTRWIRFGAASKGEGWG